MAQEIIPRWEWRTFSESFAGSSNPFASFEAGDAQDSDEVYFLSSANSENVKVRDALIDIKTLQHVNPDGLQQWKPILKHGFPLPAAEIKQVFDVLAAAPPTLTRADYTLQQLVDELIMPVPSLRVVKVHKRRTRYTVDGCMAEVADIAVEDKTIRTIALELEDAAHVIATVRKLGLAGYQNISYPVGLKRLIGMAS